MYHSRQIGLWDEEEKHQQKARAKEALGEKIFRRAGTNNPYARLSLEIAAKEREKAQKQQERKWATEKALKQERERKRDREEQNGSLEGDEGRGAPSAHQPNAFYFDDLLGADGAAESKEDAGADAWRGAGGAGGAAAAWEDENVWSEGAWNEWNAQAWEHAEAEAERGAGPARAADSSLPAQLSHQEQAVLSKLNAQRFQGTSAVENSDGQRAQASSAAAGAAEAGVASAKRKKATTRQGASDYFDTKCFNFGKAATGGCHYGVECRYLHLTPHGTQCAVRVGGGKCSGCSVTRGIFHTGIFSDVSQKCFWRPSEQRCEIIPHAGGKTDYPPPPELQAAHRVKVGEGADASRLMEQKRQLRREDQRIILPSIYCLKDLAPYGVGCSICPKMARLDVQFL